MKPTRVNVPATTANLGPGYDCLGMALDIWNTVELRPAQGTATRVEVQGKGLGVLAEDETNLVYRAVASVFQRVGMPPPPMQLVCHNQIPLSRGLGSSSAAIVGGLVAGNDSIDSPLSNDELLELAVEIEGHPDNVTPGLLGGLRIVTRDGEQVVTVPVAIPDDLTVVVYVPEMSIATHEARKVLPPQVSREDAVFNVARAAMLVNAIASNRLDDLRWGTADRLHQPYREKLFPAMKLLFAAAMDGGALGVFLSGSGSSILALTRGNEMTVSYELLEAGRRTGVPGEVKVTRPTQLGAHVVGSAVGSS